MFAAIKALKEVGIVKAPLTVKNKDGHVVHNNLEAANIIARHFHGQFSAPDVKRLPMFEGMPRTLNRQITSAEVEAVVQKMKSGNLKAVGPDGLPIETLKAGGTVAAAFVAEVLNASYSLHKSVNIGDGILRALQKPGKPAGPLDNLRPIVLLTLLYAKCYH